MAFSNDDIQEIKTIVQEVIGEQSDPIEDATQIAEFAEGDVVPIVRTNAGVSNYGKAPVELFGGSGGTVIVDSALSTTSKNPVQNKVVTAALNSKQALLVDSGSGQNIKTINGQSLLGTGDIPVSGAGTVPVITATATVDATTGTPAVSVVKSGTDAAPNFAFAFTGLKGESGGGGGGTGTVTGAKVGSGSTISPDSNGIVNLPNYETNADVTDSENVKAALGVKQGGTRYLKENGEWDTPAGGGGGGSVTGVKGSSESTYRTGNVEISPSNIGLGNVGNFKAVSTAASQGLSNTEKTNARANIGAGTSSFSGSYNDLTNKPTIPTSLSQLSGDSTHRVVTDTEKATWNAKQNALTFASESVCRDIVNELT